MNAQADGSWGASGDAGTTSPVRIAVTSKRVTTAAQLAALPASNVFADVSGVMLGGSIQIAGSLAPNLYVLILGQGNVVVQTVFFHTSCSQPLRVGDVYGAMEIRSITLTSQSKGTTLTVDCFSPFFPTPSPTPSPTSGPTTSPTTPPPTTPAPSPAPTTPAPTPAPTTPAPSPAPTTPSTVRAQ